MSPTEIVLALANEAASAEGVDLARSAIAVNEEPAAEGRRWRVYYGPKEFSRMRGGDLSVIVDEASGQVVRVVRGQ